MSLVDWPTVKHFEDREFDYPDLIGPEVVRFVDELRERYGGPIKINSDVRTDEDMKRIYGSDRTTWPNSPHPRGTALDFEPVPNSSANRLMLLSRIGEMYATGDWPGMGLEVASAHLHVDFDKELRRPHIWIGRSR